MTSEADKNSMHYQVLVLIFAVVSMAVPTALADSSMCVEKPCFIDHGTNPPSARNCREDKEDLFYQTRLKPPAAICPTDGKIRNLVPLAPIRKECFARAMQLGRSVAAMSTFCASETGSLMKVRRPNVCPTATYVETVRGWTNRTLECLNPANFNNPALQKYHISPALLFRIMAHESRGQINAASSDGKGLMQLTGIAVQEFYTPSRTGHRQFWTAAKDSAACSEFREPMELSIPVSVQSRTVTRKVGRKRVKRTERRERVGAWECQMTAPEAIPRHLIVATTNLYLCRMMAERQIASRMNNLSRVRTVAQGNNQEREAIIEDLVAACHNWGSGNMMAAVRGISKQSFKDSNEFRSNLIKNGWRFTGGDGVRSFPQLTRDGYNKIEKGDPDFGQEPLGRCTE